LATPAAVRPIFRPAEASLLRIRASVELAALALRSKALMERLACAKAADPVNLAASLSALSSTFPANQKALQGHFRRKKGQSIS
jgi:hypothetical protein